MRRNVHVLSNGHDLHSHLSTLDLQNGWVLHLPRSETLLRRVDPSHESRTCGGT